MVFDDSKTYIFIVESTDSHHNRRVYSIGASTPEECMTIFYDYVGDDESFVRIREIITPSEYKKDKL